MRKKIITLLLIVLIIISGIFIINNNKFDEKDAKKLYDNIKNIGYYLDNDTNLFTREFSNNITEGVMSDDFKYSICFLSLNNHSYSEFKRQYKKLFGKTPDVKKFNLLFNKTNTEVILKDNKLVSNKELDKKNTKVKFYDYNVYQDGSIMIVIDNEDFLYGIDFDNKYNLIGIKIIMGDI